MNRQYSWTSIARALWPSMTTPLSSAGSSIRTLGDRFFRQVSRYDDYLVEVAERPRTNPVTPSSSFCPF